MCTGKRVLATEEGFGHIAECGCGTVHVTIGPVSVALDAHSLIRLNNLLGAAVAKAHSTEIAEPESIFFHTSHFESKKVLKLKH
jgi:hypothetical protein